MNRKYLKFFVDLDECLAGTSECPDNTYCVNKDIGYDCPCSPGYNISSDGSGSCVNINECQGVNECDKEFANCTLLLRLRKYTLNLNNFFFELLWFLVLDLFSRSVLGVG